MYCKYFMSKKEGKIILFVLFIQHFHQRFRRQQQQGQSSLNF